MGQAAKKVEVGPELISLAEVARRCGIHKQTCAARLEDLGYEPDPSSTAKLKLFPFDDEMEFAVKSAKDTVSAMKIRQLRADAQLKELKLAEQRGDMVPIVDVVDRVQIIFTKLYKEFAAQQPKRIGNRLARAKTVPEVLKILKLDTEKIFGRLHDNDEEFVPKMK